MSISKKTLARDFGLECRVTRQLAELVNTPRALTVEILVRYGEWQQLVDLRCNPSHYLEVDAFREDYQVTELLKKSPNLPLDVDRAGVAVSDFYTSELRCAMTNQRLSDGESPDKGPLEYTVNREVMRILGVLTEKDNAGKSSLERVEENFRMGPGATTGVKGRGSVTSDKFDATLHLTRELYPFYKALLGPTWWESADAKPTVVDGNKFTTVPKNAKKDRGICIEPTLNVFGQLGIGAEIRRLLKVKTGLDLNTQEVNQFLASKAEEWDLCTIDLSSASDTLSEATVFSLLPDDWFDLLNLFRSKSSSLKEGVVELSKFSSMGNGFTFELESLIFWAIVRGIVRKSDLPMCAVYGDDLIVPREYAGDLIEALEHFGFSVNQEKSFLAGSFFESCGTDWFHGQNVRPFYLRGRRGEIPYALQIANSLRGWASSKMDGHFCDAAFRPLWKWLVGLIPAPWNRCWVPPSLGDVGIHSDSSEVKKRPVTPENWRTWEGECVQYVRLASSKKRKSTPGLLFGALMNGSEFTYGREPIRGLFGRIRTKRTVVRWSMGFAWLG